MKHVYALFAALLALAASATNHQVQVGSNFFNPASLTVALGDTVTWTQVSGAHNVNGSLATFPSNPAGFTSGAVAGGTWTFSHQFTVAGVYNYQCDPHIPAMVGTVTVTSGGTSVQAGSYTFGSNGNVTSFAYNGPVLTGVTASALTKNGFTSTSGANAFRGNDWPLGATNGSNTFTGSLDPTKYIEFTITAATGQTFSNPKVRFDLYRSSTGPRQYAWRSSLNNYATNIALDSLGTGVTAANGEMTLTDVAQTYADNVFQLTQSNLTSVTFRLYGYNAEAATGTGGLQTALEFFVTTSGSGGGGGGGGGTTTGPAVRAIGTIRGVNNDGVADSNNVVVRLRGVVTTNDFRASGYTFHLQDATGGIVVFRSADLTNYTTPLRGDSLEVYGTINQFNGLLQIIPDTIKLRAQNRPLPSPWVVTNFTEANEGKLVRINNLSVSTWPATWSGSGQNITLTDGSNSYTMRVVPLSGMWNRPQPSGMIDVIGGLQQFDNTLPYTSGYQIFPRDTNDVIPVVVTTPTIRFVGSSAIILEGNVSQTIKLHVQPHLMAAGSVTLTASPGTGFVLGTDATTTPALSGTTLTLPVPIMADTVSFSVNVIDDSNIEGNENVLFTLTSGSTGLTLGAPSTFTFTIADNDVYIPTRTLPQVKGINAQGIPDSNNKMCKLVGTVLGVNTQTFATTGNLAFTIHDGSVGFGVFGAGTKNLGYTVNEGDVVRIIGVIGHFNGLAQINADSIVVVSTNATLPTPVVITELGEVTESQLIRMNDVYVINPAQWTNAGSGFSVNVTDGTDTIQLRIDADVSDVYNSVCPVGTFDVVGIGGQFDNSAPHTSGYQFLPRYLADFIYPIPVTYDLAITEVMPSSNDANSAINEDWFEITNYGTTAVDLAGFSWDDNSWNPGTVVFPSVTINPGEAIVVAQIDSANEAAFRAAWNLGPWVQVLVNQDFASSQPSFSASGDGVVLFDTSATAIEVCRAEYTNALAGYSVEFDTACTYLGNAAVGVRGAYASTGNDVGSPGNQTVGLGEGQLLIGLHPNPTTGTVHLQLPGVSTYRIAVRNLNGQILANQQVNADRAEINLSALARGMYLVEVVSEAGRTTQRVVLQ
ncbi:MAG: T9SS type A sorting domain-containing protein [Bacteroidetes bacterium]|nr:T9SS type A sorting domain-containing protein [Bacteroidota bacterium]